MALHRISPLLVILAASVLAVLSLLPGSSARGAKSNSKIDFAMAEIKSYSGALMLQRESSGESSAQLPGPKGAYLILRTKDAVDTVIERYKELVSAHAGELVYVSPAVGANGGVRGMSFSLQDTLPYVPTRLLVGVSAQSLENGTKIVIRHERWPEPSMVPLYPGASQVKTVQSGEPESPYPQRTITYRVSTSAADVEAFYRRELEAHGWWQVDLSEPGLHFTYGHGGPHNLIGSSVHVTWATLDDNGGLLVTITVNVLGKEKF